MVNKVENIITVINYIENNLTEKLNLSSIARGVGYSKYHLHRMFVETVGLSIHDYVQRRQLNKNYHNKKWKKISDLLQQQIYLPA